MQLELLIDRYCEAWTEPHPEKRAELLAAVWGSDATYTDPLVGPLNNHELLEHISRIQATRPGASVRRTTVVDAHHGMLRFGFEVLGHDGAVLRTGIDVVVLTQEQTRIQQVVGFFGELTSLQPGA